MPAQNLGRTRGIVPFCVNMCPVAHSGPPFINRPLPIIGLLPTPFSRRESHKLSGLPVEINDRPPVYPDPRGNKLRLNDNLGVNQTSIESGQRTCHMMIGVVKRVTAVFLVAMAVAVAVNLILTPVYHDGSPEYPVWRILNWFMAVAVFLALAASYLRRRDVESADADTLRRLRAGMAFYGAIVLTMLFFWGWLWTLNSDSETGDAVTSHLIYFPIVDSLFVVVALTTGRHLWSDGGGR